MRTAGLAFLTSTATAAVLTPVVRDLAHRWGVLDHALTSRKVHGKSVPRLGGIAIVIAFLVPLIALYFVNSDVGHRFWVNATQAFGLIGGGLAIALLGIYDDLKGSSAKVKFLVQFGVAAAMYFVGFRIDYLSNPFGEAIHLGWFGLPFTMLWIAGVINALNLIDGLDGLAGGVAFIAIGTTFAIAAFQGNALMLLFAGALGGAVLGFLFYNFNPASIFMGDTGSMFLGFVLATTSLQTNQKSSAAVSLVIPIIALGIPIADTLLSMTRRAVRGLPMFSADRGHIHHRLLDLGLSHRKTVLVLYGVSTFLGAAALAMTFATKAQAAWYILGLLSLAFFALRALGYFSIAKTRNVLEERKRNMETRTAIRRIGLALRRARSIDDVWVAVRMASSSLDAVASALYVPDEGRDPREPAFEEGFTSEQRLFRARFCVLVERGGEDQIEFGWSDGRITVDRDTEIAIELLCEHLATALERIRLLEDPPENVIPFAKASGDRS